MDSISELTIRLIIILIPGTIAALIIETISIHKKWDQFRLVLSAVLLGVSSYGILQILYWLYQFLSQLLFSCYDSEAFKSLSVWSSLFNQDVEVNALEIGICSIIAVILGYYVGKIIQFKVVNRIAQRFGFSNRFGDDSLYSHFLNNPDVDWVYVRDRSSQLSYRGQVYQFAEEGQSKELVLLNVTVYDYDTSTEGYQLKSVYLRFHERDMVIEEANESKTESNGKKEGQS